MEQLFSMLYIEQKSYKELEKRLQKEIASVKSGEELSEMMQSNISDYSAVPMGV